MTGMRAMALGLTLALSSLTASACDNGIANISGGTTYPPLSWQEEGKLRGTSIDIVKEIFAEVDIRVNVDEGGPWKRVLLRAKNNQLDMVVGVRRTLERERYLDYIEPALTPSVQGVFMSVDRQFRYKNWQDLENRIGSMTLGSSFGEGFDQFAEDKLYIEEVRTVAQNFRKMALNRVDYIVGPLMPTLLYIRQEGFSGQIVEAPTPLTTINEFLAFNTQSPCLRYKDHFSRRLAEYLDTGKIDDIMEEHFMYWFDQESHLSDDS